MKSYIATKVITAKPMTREQYHCFRDWSIPANECGEDEGYLIVSSEGAKPNFEEYVSRVDCVNKHIAWIPKGEFESTYRETSSMSFGQALEALKSGEKVARTGWNGKDMWLALSCAKTKTVKAENFWSSANQQYAEKIGGEATVLPCITMKTADGNILMGWLASQTDMLSSDWVVV